MIKIVKYTEQYKNDWDQFVSKSKNSFFQFYRDYMEYHSCRFKDHSLLFYKDNILIGLFPANIDNNILHSHQGLTFGGILLGHKNNAKIVLDIFDELKKFCVHQKIKYILYKHLPNFYSKVPSEEILYAIIKSGGTIKDIEITTTIDLLNPGKVSTRRKRSIKNAQKSNIVFVRSEDWDTFWELLSKNLETKYKVHPTHTLSEISALKEKFRNNIQLYCAYMNDVVIAGTVIYKNQHVAHAQYIATSETGMLHNALDGLFDYLITMYSKKNEIRYFDFGVSTDRNTGAINYNLIKFKEEFGGGSNVHMTLKQNL